MQKNGVGNNSLSKKSLKQRIQYNSLFNWKCNQIKRFKNSLMLIHYGSTIFAEDLKNVGVF